MGYRSEIYIKVDKNIEDKFCDLISEHDLVDLFEKVMEDGEHSYYEGGHLEWYIEYKDVKAINGFIDDNHKTCALLGIGEDGAESARAGSPDKLDMFLVSSIDW